MPATTSRRSDLTIWHDYGAEHPWCVVTRRGGWVAKVHSRWATEPEAEGALAATEQGVA